MKSKVFVLNLIFFNCYLTVRVNVYLIHLICSSSGPLCILILLHHNLFSFSCLMHVSLLFPVFLKRLPAVISYYKCNTSLSVFTALFKITFKSKTTGICSTYSKPQFHYKKSKKTDMLCSSVFSELRELCKLYTSFCTLTCMFCFNPPSYVCYRDHTECPVSACTCKCMQLDTTGNLVPSDSS